MSARDQHNDLSSGCSDGDEPDGSEELYRSEDEGENFDSLKLPSDQHDGQASSNSDSGMSAGSRESNSSGDGREELRLIRASERAQRPCPNAFSGSDTDGSARKGRPSPQKMIRKSQILNMRMMMKRSRL